jgi:hypothetical protein
MKYFESIKEDASIVLIGEFNPEIFHPEWFIRNGIIPDLDYTALTYEIISNGFSKIEFTDNKSLIVTTKKLVYKSDKPTDYYHLKDLITSIFNELDGTNITAMGMNFDWHLKFTDKDSWKNFGHVLAPRECWIESIPYLKTLQGSDDEKFEMLGLSDLTMHSPRNDDNHGHIRHSIEALDLKRMILSYRFNSHVVINSTTDIIKILNDSWDESRDFAKETFTNLISNVNNGE